MADLRFRLSQLPDLGNFLVQRAQTNEDLQAALDDGLDDYQEGAEVVLTALRALLDEYISEGHTALRGISEMGEPYKWLGTSAHLEAIETFRGLL